MVTTADPEKPKPSHLSLIAFRKYSNMPRYMLDMLVWWFLGDFCWPFSRIIVLDPWCFFL